MKAFADPYAAFDATTKTPGPLAVGEGTCRRRLWTRISKASRMKPGRQLLSPADRIAV